MPEEIEIKYVVYGVICFVVGLFFLNTIKFMGAGESAIIFNKFSGMTDKRLHEGVNLINPLTDKVVKYNIKLQKTDFSNIEGMSADNQTIGLSIAVNWKLQPTHLKDIYQTIVGRVEDTVMYNIVMEVSKASLGKFKIGDIATNREALRKAVEESLKTRMSQYYIDIINISIVDVQFSDEYEKAIEAKQVAQQKAQQAEYEKQATVRAAEAQAQSNQLLQQTVTDKVIKLKMIEKWDGKYPTVIAGNSPLLLNLGTAAQ